MVGRWILAGSVAFYLSVGWYAYVVQPIQRNGGEWGRAGKLVFSETGLAGTGSVPEWIANVRTAESVEISLEMAAQEQIQFGPARILTISRDVYFRKLTIRQEGRDLVVRVRRAGADENGIPPYRVANVFEEDGWHCVTVKIDRRNLEVVVDGQGTIRKGLTGIPFETWDTGYGLVLGNEALSRRPWLGKIQKVEVRVDGEKYDYLGNGLLELPGYFWRLGQAPHYGTLVDDFWPFGNKAPDLDDWVVNLLGFVPLGLVAGIYNKRDKWKTALWLCLVCTLLIEGGQGLVPTRTPEVTDVILNASGGLIGALVLEACSKKNDKPFGIT